MFPGENPGVTRGVLGKGKIKVFPGFSRGDFWAKPRGFFFGSSFFPRARNVKKSLAGLKAASAKKFFTDPGGLLILQRGHPQREKLLRGEEITPAV